MHIFLKGVALGFSLSFLVGPLLFALVQASIERGPRAGLAVAAGIWASDVLFVVAVLFFVEKIEWLTAVPGFQQWAGLAGGLLLVGFGLANFFGKKTPAPLADGAVLIKSGAFRGSPAAHFTKGFLVNSINPFTVFFWLGVTGTVVVPNRWGAAEALTFFGGMLATLVATDSLKVFLCKKLGPWLTEAHVRRVRQAVGAALVAFGAVLVWRAVSG